MTELRRVDRRVPAAAPAELSLPSPFTTSWTATTDIAASGRSATAALQVLTGGANTATGTATASNTTGFTAAVAWGSITAAVTPANTGAVASARTQTRYGYLGAKQRTTSLPSGVIEMGSRVYAPQLGRFLQTDPVYGGSANTYDYTGGDPVNMLDLDGRRVVNGKCYRYGGSKKGWFNVGCPKYKASSVIGNIKRTVRRWGCERLGVSACGGRVRRQWTANGAVRGCLEGAGAFSLKDLLTELFNGASERSLRRNLIGTLRGGAIGCMAGYMMYGGSR